MTETDFSVEHLDPSWKQVLQPCLQSPQVSALRDFLQQKYQEQKTIYPERANYFAAFRAAPVHGVRVVILGQDPYHGPGQAHGLCFSVPQGVRPPPSLVNIFKELESDLQIPRSRSGDLTRWAQQGVLLLNSVLTVEEGLPGSHAKKGWEFFTDEVIQYLNANCSHLVFILWGSYAQKKAQFVDRSKHLVLEAVHPSPLSAHRGFFGSSPFSQTNQYLRAQGLQEIDWNLQGAPSK